MFRLVLASSRAGDGACDIAEGAWQDLDWPLLCEELAPLCSTADGRALAADLGVLPAQYAATRRDEICEAMGLHTHGSMPPIGDTPSLRHAILRCKKVDALDAGDLLGLAALLVSAARVRRFYLHHSEHAPLLSKHAQTLGDHKELAEEIRRTFDDAGLMRDEASTELAQRRRRLKRVRNAISARMDRYLRDPRYKGILQDGFVTLRDERFVLPVRAGERGDMHGIVHAQSGSGGTLFIEPQELVPLNNELAVVQTDIAVEERRIRRVLTASLFAIIDEVEHAADMLAFLDLTNAQAALCGQMRAHRVALRADDATGFELRAARHPLLALRTAETRDEPFEVVANTIEVQDSTRALVISGPNTGGKTVVLKTIGLCALMVRAGFALPASADASARVYGRVFSDIGDEQNIQSNLSTFSGHVTNIASFVTEVQQGDLVLLDELFAGTDPAQAATLGRALIDDLIARGAFVVVTTHLEGLKSIAFEDDRYAAASMAFDLDKLAPTYRMRPGIPGASWAHRIAARLGMPKAIIEHAQALEAPTGGGAVDETQLARIETALREAEAAQTTAEQLRAAAKDDRMQAAKELARARDKERRVLDKELQNTREEARELRASIRTLRQKMRALLEAERPTDEQAARIIEEARAAVRRVEERTRKERVAIGPVDARPAPLIHDLQLGDRVWVVPYQHEAVIDERAHDAASIAVRMGPVRMRVPIAHLRLLSRDHTAPQSTFQAGALPNTRDDDLSFRVDLRGERVEDAEDIIEAFMERAHRASLPFVLFIHGHGTGALRRGVRAKLQQLPYPLRIRAGEQGEGGEGVTFAEFVPKNVSGNA